MDRLGFYRDFITAWYELPTAEAVGARFSRDRRWASNTAAHLRRHGVKMPCKKAVPHRHGDPGYVTDFAALKQWANILHGREQAERYRRGA